MCQARENVCIDQAVSSAQNPVLHSQLTDEETEAQESEVILPSIKGEAASEFKPRQSGPGAGDSPPLLEPTGPGTVKPASFKSPQHLPLWMPSHKTDE